MPSVALYHYHLDHREVVYGIIAIAGGQSNAGNLFSGSLNALGKVAFLEEIDAAISDENDFINGSEGSSFLSKNAADNASSAEYWVNDDTGTLAAGPELENFYEAVTVAGYANADVTHVVWAQGESDAPRIANGTITKANYKTDMEWLFDDFRGNFLNLQSIVIIPIGPRTVSSPGTQQVREVQQEVAASDVLLAAEVYDQPLADSVHFTEEGYAVIGERLADRLLRGLGESVTHAEGPEVTDVAFSGGTITLTVTHDGGTTLNGFTSTPVDATASSGSNFFRCFDGNGVELTISTVQVTAADEITITLALEPIANFTLYGGYGAMEGVTDTDLHHRWNVAPAHV
jgi:Carbohydrate esterase, sialic acid-specific acetylesterase